MGEEDYCDHMSSELYYQWLNIIFAQVEYLLLECIQDLTGGAACFYLASYSYMVDITSPESRTKRLSLLDSFMPIGFFIGLPLGTHIRTHYGYVALYSTAGSVILAAILYVALVLKESIKKEPKSEEETGQRRGKIIVKPNKGKNKKFNIIFFLFVYDIQQVHLK